MKCFHCGFQEGFRRTDQPILSSPLDERMQDVRARQSVRDASHQQEAGAAQWSTLHTGDCLNILEIQRCLLIFLCPLGNPHILTAAFVPDLCQCEQLTKVL